MDLGTGQPGEGQVERVEHGALWIGKKGHAHKEVGVPQRDPPLAQRFGGIGAVWIKVGKGVHPWEDQVGQGNLAVHEQGERRDRQAGKPRATREAQERLSAHRYPSGGPRAG